MTEVTITYGDGVISRNEAITQQRASIPDKQDMIASFIAMSTRDEVRTANDQAIRPTVQAVVGTPSIVIPRN